MTDFSDVKNYASFLKKLTPNQLTVIGSLIGVLMSQNLSADEAQSLGNVLELIGQVLLTYGSQKQLLDDESNF